MQAATARGSGLVELEGLLPFLQRFLRESHASGDLQRTVCWCTRRRPQRESKPLARDFPLESGLDLGEVVVHVTSG